MIPLHELERLARDPRRTEGVVVGSDDLDALLRVVRAAKAIHPLNPHEVSFEEWQALVTASKATFDEFERAVRPFVLP